MESITLNNNRFHFELLLVKGDGEEGYELSYNRIGQMVVSTSVFDSTAMIDFTFVEASESTALGRTSPDGTTMLTLRFGLDEEDAPEWTVGFVVDYVKLTENTGSTQTYRVRGICVDCQTLRSRVVHSVQDEDPLTTLTAMLGKAGLTVDRSGCPARSGASLPFISEAGATLLESAEVLLDRASAGRAVLFLAFSLSTGAYRICNVGASMKSSSEVSVRNVPSSAGFSPINVGSFTDVSFRDGVSLPLDYPAYSEVVSHVFSQKSRKWSSAAIGGLRAAAGSLVQDGSLFRLPVVEQERQRDFGFYFRESASNDREGIVGRINRYLATSFDRMDASMIGQFDLESGGVLTMPEQSGMEERFGGLWMVCSVSQWFTKESWTTKVMLSRLLVPRGS